MARGDRGTKSNMHGGKDLSRQNAAPAASELTEQQRAEVAALLDGIPALAQSLRAAVHDGREGVRVALAPIANSAEMIARVVARDLGDIRDVRARDAADVAAAVGELDSRREVAREARRARIRLRSAGAPASLIVPPAAPTSQPADSGPEPSDLIVSLADRQPTRPKLVEAYATRTREQGEIALVLGWQEGRDPNYLRGYTFQLSFWSEGLREFALMEPMPRSEFIRETVEGLRAQQIEVVSITWAQARRLLQAALEVNDWRQTEPSDDFKRHQSQITARLLAEPDSDEQRDAIEAEERRFSRDGDRHLIGGDIEPDETIVHWLGAWSFGDFSLTYDLLTDDATPRRGHSRAEYVDVRRRWWNEADPSGLRVTLVREQEKRASALWVPGSAAATGAIGKHELEAFWSLILKEVELGGSLDELALATISSRETGRHWYWTGYTVSRDRRSGVWVIDRLRDEGASSQALTIDELQKRIAEAHKAVEEITSKAPPEPESDAASAALRAITGAFTASLHYSDALTVRLPLDETIYREAMNDARSLGNHERAAAIIERMIGRFADDVRVRFELGVEQYLAADQFGRVGQMEARAAWLDRAVKTMEGVVGAEPTAEHLQGLGELLAQQGHYQQAEARIREAIALEPENAVLYSDLADTLMGRLTGETQDGAEAPSNTDERQAVAKEALIALREASKRDNSLPSIFTRIGAIYDILGQPDDAVLALEEAVRRDPGDSEAHYALGSLLMAKRQPDRAVHALETAVQLAPYAIPYRLNLAAAYGALDRANEARQELDAIDRLQPGLPQVAEMRSVLARQGRRR